VTAADLKRVANEYLTKENRNVAVYTRKKGKTPETATQQPATEEKKS